MSLPREERGLRAALDVVAKRGSSDRTLAQAGAAALDAAKTRLIVPKFRSAN